MLSKEPEHSIERQHPKLFANIVGEAAAKPDTVLELTLKLAKSDISEIVEMTVGQNDILLWHLMRQDALRQTILV